MNKVRIVAAVLLAFPLLLFGGSFFVHPFALPPPNGSAGIEMLHLMRNGGLTNAVAGSHFIAGVFLLVPRTRFVAALLQLPMTIGIVSFHAFMWREGIPVALVMLLLNLIVLAERRRLRALVAREPSPGKQPG